MFVYILSLLSLVVCKELEQTLVFGKDGDGYFCEFSLNPPQTVSEVTIFQVIKDDSSVPRFRLTPTESPSSSGFSRIDIPDSLATEGIKYGFLFSFDDGEQAFSEKWMYDSSKDQFAHAYAVSPNYLKDPKVLALIGLLGFPIVVGAGIFAYKKCMKGRNAL